jgi:hypothetical protein
MKVYCINLNPFGENGQKYKKIKQECIGECLDSFFSRHPETDKNVIETISFSYRFRPGHENVQGRYIEMLMKQADSEGAVLVFMTLDSIRVRSVRSTCAMLQRCVQRYTGIAAVYLPLISMEEPFDEYWKEFLAFAHDDAGYTPGRVVAGEPAPKELLRFIQDHRGYRNFVNAADLEKHTGVRLSSIRDRSRQFDVGLRGRPITQEEIDEIREIKRRHTEEIMEMIEVFPD